MKKWIALVLTLCLTLSLCACKGSEQTAPAGTESATAAATEGATAGLQAGYARVNITPSYSVPLGGYGNTSQRMSQGFLDYLYATCIAVTDENDSTVLLITLDLIGAKNSFLKDTRDAITAATGVPADRIMMQGTHTHSGPDMDSSEPSIGKYKVELVQNIAKAAKEAMDDRSPATMYTGTGKSTDGLNFVRHYTLSTGGIYGDNLTLPSGATMTGHVAEPDTEIQLLVFKRAAEDKKDIMAVNWGCHPKLNSGGETNEGKANRGMMSADYIGGCRDYIEKNSDYLFAFYLGAAGNLNPNSKIATENVSTVCKEYSQILSEDILAGAENLTAVESTTIKSTQQIYSAEIDHSEDHLVAEARSIYTVWSETGNAKDAMATVPGTTIGSVYHAGSIINRSNQTGTRSMELNAITIGSVGFVTAPYEMFDTNAMFVKENSPFDTTFVMTCANGSNSYIAAEYAFGDGGTYEVHNRNFPKGTAEALADIYVEMLTSLK